jgi:hypothetical protein
MLTEAKYRVFTPEVLKAKSDTYRGSKDKNLDPSQRMTLLREARVDVFVTGAFEEKQ